MKKTRDLFRNNLRAIILKRDLKLEDAAEACEMSLSFLNQMLSGKSAYSPESIDKVCIGLNCRQADLFMDRADSGDLNDEATLIVSIEDELRGLTLKQLKDTKDAMRLIKKPADLNGLKTKQNKDKKA